MNERIRSTVCNAMARARFFRDAEKDVQHIKLPDDVSVLDVLAVARELENPVTLRLPSYAMPYSVVSDVDNGWSLRVDNSAGL